MKRYLYLEPKIEAPIIILAKRKPSLSTVPKSGTWLVKEWYRSQWVMPCSPEITWYTLQTLKFIGQVK